MSIPSAFKPYRHGVYYLNHGGVAICLSNQRTIPSHLKPIEDAHIQESTEPGYKYLISCRVECLRYEEREG